MKKRHIIIIGGVLIFAFVVGIVGFLPTPIIAKSNNLRIYDRSNNLIYEEVYGVKSKYIELEKLPSYVPASFIAIEDKNFYSHKGFDFKRIIKSFFINLTSFKIKEGASTISQQYARNTMLSNERTLLRKIKEAYYIFKIESKYSKQEILEGYLNSLYFGHGITGIEGASNFYFNKSAEHLTLSEATVLAAVYNAPAVYSPSINPKNTKVRQNKVLRKMYDLDFISEKQYYDAVLDSNEYYLEKDNPDNFYYYRDAVIQELVSLNLYENKAKLRGLKVITNINIDLNSKINEIIGKHKQTDEDIQVSVVVMEPFSNKVLSLNGGFDYNLSPFNRALSSKRSVASTIKPLLYYLALINNFNPTTKLTSEKTNFYIKDFGAYSPSNPSESYANGDIDMIQALALSDNIYAVKTLMLVGSENFKDLITSFNIDDVEALPSMALGTSAMSLLELTSIYNTFASLGEYYKPSFVNLVYDSFDKLLYENKNRSKTLLRENETLILNQMMQGVFKADLASYLTPTLINYKPSCKYGAKTGTTSQDSYVMAYNPKYTFGVWVGTDSGEQLSNYILVKQIFKEITNYLDSVTSPSWYSTNSRVIATRYDPSTKNFTNNGDIYYFKR